MTRIGNLELRVPRDREGRFSTELFERYQCSEKALVSALAKMNVQEVSTRKVKEITWELCAYAFSVSTRSRISKSLDAILTRSAELRLEESCPWFILDACYGKVRIDGVIRSQAVLIAIGLNWEARREVLGVELANRESHSSWKAFVIGLNTRRLRAASSSSSPTTMPASSGPSPSFCPKPSAAPAPQASRERQQARTAQRGDQAPHPPRPHLPQ